MTAHDGDPDAVAKMSPEDRYDLEHAKQHKQPDPPPRAPLKAVLGVPMDGRPPVTEYEAVATLLDRVTGFLSRFVAFASPAQRDAVALFVLHTHAFGAAETTPRLSIQSPEKQSGKTRLLEVLDVLVAAPVHAINVSEAYLFRRIDRGAITLLLDEVDAIFGPKAREREDLRALLNAGYRAGATTGRVTGEGKAMEPKDFAAFCPVALAGIGRLPDTIEDRAIVIRLVRRTSDEPVGRFRLRVVAEEAGELYSDLASWAESAVAKLAVAWPNLPDDLDDRKQDIWEPLFAIAELAGPDWASRARLAAVQLSGNGVVDEMSLGVQLLADIQFVFGDDDRMGSEHLVERLVGLDESPWGDERHRLTTRWLAKKLRPFGIRPKDHRFDDGIKKGYLRGDFTDAWHRYLSATRATSATPKPSNGNSVADVADVAHTSTDWQPEDDGARCSKADCDATGANP